MKCPVIKIASEPIFHAGSPNLRGHFGVRRNARSTASAGQREDRRSTTMPVTTRMGLHCWSRRSAALIETKATKLQQKAFQRFN